MSSSLRQALAVAGMFGGVVGGTLASSEIYAALIAPLAKGAISLAVQNLVFFPLLIVLIPSCVIGKQLFYRYQDKPLKMTLGFFFLTLSALILSQFLYRVLVIFAMASFANPVTLPLAIAAAAGFVCMLTLYALSKPTLADRLLEDLGLNNEQLETLANYNAPGQNPHTLFHPGREPFVPFAGTAFHMDTP